MQNTIKEELQQLIPANLVSSQEELSDAELESVAGGVILNGTNVRGELRINGTRRAGIGPVSGTTILCSPSFRIPNTLIPVPSSVVDSFKR